MASGELGRDNLRRALEGLTFARLPEHAHLMQAITARLVPAG
jgi:hypothetical protein